MKRKIAIIEDEATASRLFQFQMEKRGYEVSTFETPKDFEKEGKYDEYEGIISDMSFQDLDDKFAAERLYESLTNDKYKGAFMYTTANISEGRDIPILERTKQIVFKKEFNKEYYDTINSFIEKHSN